ncbi:MAG: domain S-box [Acidobacteria bacterium]|nr:domain S-box [Acidobacteriota bacterium]
MKPEDLKLFELIQSDEAAGTLYLKNRRVLLIDADALGVLRRELITKLGVHEARRVLARFGYAYGYRSALTVRQWFVEEGEDDWWRLGMKLRSLDGSVRVRPLRLEVDLERGVFEAESEWVNSYEADQHLSHLGVSPIPVCWTLVGYASGYASAVLGKEVFFVETECVGRGDARCLAYGSTNIEPGSEVARRALEYSLLSDEEFMSLIKRSKGERASLQNFLEELEKRSLELAKEHERVRELESQVVYLQESLNESYNVSELVGVSPSFKQVMRDVAQVAGSDATVLLTGETGTGKELIARAIHSRSERKQRPLVTVNCAALPAGLVESELFGHEKGAFTGAAQRRLGRFEIANGATIFLDEVGEIPLETQSKFLRVLQEGEFERVGGTQTIKVDVRVIAATNQPLQKLVAEGKFRSDLFYRLNVFPIRLPPLRERREDIRLLTNYFAQKFRARFRKNISSIEQETLERLLHYPWPGNIRELEHVVERAVLLAEGTVLKINLPLAGNETVNHEQAAQAASPAKTKLMTFEEMERHYLQEVLKRTGGVIAGKGGAAEILNLPASTLRSRMKKLGLR